MLDPLGVPLDDVRVRKAINMAINKDRIIKIINGRAIVANQPLHGPIGRGQVRRDHIEVEIGLGVEDCAAHRDADRAAEIAHHVKQPACIFEPFRRQAAEAEVDRGRHREDLREAAQYLRNQEFSRAPIAGDVAEGPHRQTERGEAEHHQPAYVEFARQQNVGGHPGQRGGTGREDRDTRLPGAEPADIAEK